MSDTLVSRLLIQMAADTAQLTRDMATAKSVVGGTMDEIKGHISTVKGALAGLAGAFALVELKNLANSAVEGAAALNKLSIQTGATVESLSAMKGIAKLVGSDIETVAGAMNKMSKAMAVTNEDSKGAGTAIQALGINLDEFKKMKPDEQMLAVAKAMDKFEDSGGKSAAAMALFGKTGAQLLPFMKDLAASGELQAKVTKEQAVQAEEYEKNLTRLKVSSEGWKKELSMGMLPAMNDITKAFLGTMNGTNGLRDGVKKLSADGSLAEWTRDAATGLSYVLDGVTYVIRAFKVFGEFIVQSVTSSVEFFASAGEAMTQFATGNWTGAWKTMSTAVKVQKEIWSGFGDKMKEIWGADTLGAQFRARLAEVQALGKVAKETKEDLDFNGNEKNNKSGGVDKEAQAYGELIKKIQEYKAAQAASLTQQEKLTAGQKMALDIMEALRNGSLQLTDARKANLSTLLELMLATEKQADLHDRETKANLAAAEAQVKYTKELGESIVKVEDAAKKQREHNAEIGLSKEAIAELDAARHEETATLIEQQAIRALDKNLNEAEYGDKMRLAQAERDLAKAKREGGAAQAAYDEQQKQIASFKSTWESIDKTAHDVFVSIFEGGSNVFKKLGQTLKASLLDILYQMTVKQWVISIAASVTGAAPSIVQAATGGGGGLGGLFGGGGFGTGTTSVNPILSSMGTFGSGLSAGFSGLTNGIGSLFGATGTGTTFMGTLDAGFTALGAGNIAGGLGTLAGALGPIALGIGLVASYLSKQGETRSGGQYVNGQFIGGPSGGQIGGDSVTQAINATTAGINATLKALGSSLGASYFVAGLESSKEGKGFAYAGGSLSNGTVFGQGVNGQGYMNNRGNMTPEQATAAFQKELEQATLQALQAATDIPESIAKQLRGIDIDAITDEARKALLSGINASIVAVNAFDAAFGSLPFPQLIGLTFDLKSAMIEAGGGIQQFTQNVSGYIQNFLSEDERRQLSASNIAKTLQGVGLGYQAGDILGMSRAQFRSLVEAIDTTTDAGARMYAAFMNVQGAFASLVPAAQAVSVATDTVNTSMTDLQKTLDAAKQSWYDNFTPDEQKKKDIAQGILDKIGALFSSGFGINLTADQLLGFTRDDFARAMNQLKSMGAAGAPFVAALESVADQLASITGWSTTTGTALGGVSSNMANLQATTQSLRVQLLTMRGDAVGAAALQRAIDTAGWSDAEKAVYDFNNALRAQITLEQQAQANVDKTKQALVTAYQREASALESTITKLRDFAKGIRDFQNSLLLNDALSPLTPEQKYAQALKDFQVTSAAAKGGDANAQARLQSVATALLDASRSFNGSSTRYTSDFNLVQSALKQVATSADAQASVQQLQLTYLKSQLAALGSIDNSAISIVDALGAYNDAVIALAHAITVTNGMTPPASGGLQPITPPAPYLGPPVMNPIAGIPMQGAANDGAVVGELRALRAEVKQLREQNNDGHEANVAATVKSSDAVGKGFDKAMSTAQRKSANKPVMA